MTDDNPSLEDLLIKGAVRFGITLGREQIEKFIQYKNALKHWNKKVNLTSITGDEEVIIKHFLDSLSVVPFIRSTDKRLIDIGTGAGFPGMPVKLVKEDLEALLVDSLEKRIKFLNEMISMMDLEGIRAVHARAEDLAFGEYREAFDVCVARAVASLPTLLEYCLPFVRTGGRFIAMKASFKEEIESSGKALEILGGSIEKVEEFYLPFSDIKRAVILIKKFRQTRTGYPRKAGKPSKNPLI